MNKKMLIDASYKEETRVVILDGNCIESYDIENSAKKQLKGNIYLAKIVRIEPSLQAAFVDYGGNRHGFLAFNEIHPDYYQIPVADRKKLIELQELNKTNNEDPDEDSDQDVSSSNQLLKNYKIQEVIHKRQIILVQVVKEERGNKGAALTTYLSLAGRYCVLMPNSLRNGGVSRKITSPVERKRLKDIITELDIPAHMGIIIRTAGAQCPKPDTLKDGEYLLHLWDEIRNLTMKSIAPTLIYEDSSLLKLALRDIYTSDINEILVDGEEAWSQIKDYMRALMPQNVHKLHLWRDQKQSLFSHYKIEHLIEQMLSPIVQLKSGGYLVINQTEALVAIDVNSGRSIKEKDLEETALRTNQEAAQEISRQLRLRDLAGLIVIDFIDMENRKHNFLIERRLKSLLHKDRARIQIGSISSFGLLEMTRQRLRPSITEFAFTPCSNCNGTGIIRSDANISLQILRQIDEEARKTKPGLLTVSISSGETALYILNQKREWLANIEKKHKIKIDFAIDPSLSNHQVSFTSKNDPSIENGQENDTVNASAVLLQDNLFVREIPIQSNFGYTPEPEEVIPYFPENEPASTLEPQVPNIIQPFASPEDEQPAIPFYPIPEEAEAAPLPPRKQKDKKNTHYSQRNRYRKTKVRESQQEQDKTVNTPDANPPADLPSESRVIPIDPEYKNEGRALILSAVADEEKENKPVPLAEPSTPSHTSENSETEPKPVSEKKNESSRNSHKARTTKPASAKTSSKKNTEEKPDIALMETDKDAKDDEKKESVKPPRKTSTRTRKPSTRKKTTDKKATDNTETDKGITPSIIQPIIIDDTPSTPRSGWWKR